MLQLPAKRIDFADGYIQAQLKAAQEVIALAVFLPIAVFNIGQPPKWGRLWAGLCMAGAGYFMFRS